MKKKIIWMVVAVIGIIAAVLGILYYTTDLFKTPKQLFYKYFASSSTLLDESNYEDFLAELKAESEKSMEVVGEITAKITSNDEDVKQVETVLEKGKIKYNMKTVGKEQKMQNDITLNYDGKDIVTLSVLKNKEQYGLKIAEAYEKYVSVENNNLKALFQKLGMDTTEIPNKIEMVDYYELLNIDKETLEHIETTYSKVINENIPEECYSVEKDVAIEVNNKIITTNAHKLTLTEEQVKTVVAKMLETLKTDDKTLDLIVNKVNTMLEPYKNLSEVDTLTKEEFIKEIEDSLIELNEVKATSSNALEIIVYSAKENRTKIRILALDESKEVLKTEIDMVKDESNNNIIMKMSDEDTVMDITMSYNDTKADTIMNMESEGTKITVSMKEEIKATENISVENFNSNNSVKLNDMTEAEIGQLVQTIYYNVINALPQKMQLLGINTLGPSNAF